MRRNNRYRLLWIRVLMFASQALLVALIYNWLASQYQQEKTALKTSMKMKLDDSRQKISDSLIYSYFISPIMDKVMVAKEAHTDNKKKMNISSGIKGLTLDFTTDSSTDNILDSILTMVKTENTGFFTYDTTNTLLAGKNPKTTIALSREDVAKEVLAPVLMTVMSSIMGTDSVVAKDSFMRIDTLGLHRQFRSNLTKAGQNFNITWLNTRRGFYLSSSEFIIDTRFYGRNYYAVISGFNGYLFRSITPQILFTVVLLLLIAIAFWLSYRTIKEQTRLSIIKNEFISNMSHELKTPISTVKVALEALTNFNMVENPAITREYLQMASHEMNRLDMLVNQSLNAALLEEGKIVISKQKEELQQILNDTLQVLKIRLQQHNATLTTDIENDSLYISADRLHVQGVLINLIDNSLKYGGKPPVIAISLKDADKHILLFVSDNGPGIPQEYMGKIYDKFFRVPKGDKHDVKGYGLGLSYAKQIMKQHGGDISVQNHSQGGCTFTLTFPKAAI